MNLALGLVCLVGVVIATGEAGLPDSNEVTLEHMSVVSSNDVKGLIEKQRSEEKDLEHSDKVDLTHIQEPSQRRGKGYCRRKLKGRCVKLRKRCPRRLPEQTSRGRPFCRSRFHRCCHKDVKPSCNTTGMESIGSGMFKVSSGEQSWEASKQWCLSQGLVMAQDMGDILANDLAKHLGNKNMFAWLGAKGDGNHGNVLVWNNGNTMTASADLFFEGLPFNSTNQCLLTMYDETPYHTNRCDQDAYSVCMCP